MAQGRYDTALAECKHALQLTPENAEYHLLLGNIYAVLGQFDAARNAYQNSLNLKPNFNGARERLDKLSGK
jgi:Flp pilus assembly protein TadD